MEELLTQVITLNYVIYFEYVLAVKYDDYQTKQVYNGQKRLKTIIISRTNYIFKIKVKALGGCKFLYNST